MVVGTIKNSKLLFLLIRPILHSLFPNSNPINKGLFSFIWIKLLLLILSFLLIVKEEQLSFIILFGFVLFPLDEI